jgi:hypothetical protein
VSEETNPDRRRFLGTATMSIAAAQLSMIGSAAAQSGKTKLTGVPPIKPGTNTSFGSLKQIDAGLLSVGYAEVGPLDGPPVVLLQGWPYDIYSYVDVAPLLASAGYRVIVPYLRGFGPTRFLSSETFRNGQQSVVALDIINLMDALNIKSAILSSIRRFSANLAFRRKLWKRSANHYRKRFPSSGLALLRRSRRPWHFLPLQMRRTLPASNWPSTVG